MNETDTKGQKILQRLVQAVGGSQEAMYLLRRMDHPEESEEVSRLVARVPYMTEEERSALGIRTIELGDGVMFTVPYEAAE